VDRADGGGRRDAAGAALGRPAAVVFGLWHVSTALGDARPAGSPVLAVASVAGTVVLTALGGVLFGWLRLRSGSLLAPAGLHLATNSAGLLAAAVAGR
jgi:uncharacterized protein